MLGNSWLIVIVACEFLTDSGLLQLFANAALQVEIEKGTQENQKLLKDIDNLKTMLLSTIIIEDDQWYGLLSLLMIP